ncbi:hypothetical protein NR996_02030 [Lactobacillus rodentium]|uniref:Uncharacterized protein n=1 Tax=Lactobacillus rodentium TaxID=947835 RepID=A0A2Z6T857_9LACO|nr:hypothetical protein [Lactobacillus rodentium]MCR1894191.1 hypothetical protein [Lactobacillus rodentium]GBG04488.1 hypothetical protein LrDSM24759_04020 [Lactobacillus rodentium]
MEINNQEKNTFIFLVNENVPISEVAYSAPNCEYKILQHKNKNKNLKGINIEEWS